MLSPFQKSPTIYHQPVPNAHANFPWAAIIEKKKHLNHPPPWLWVPAMNFAKYVWSRKYMVKSAQSSLEFPLSGRPWLLNQLWAACVAQRSQRGNNKGWLNPCTPYIRGNIQREKLVEVCWSYWFDLLFFALPSLKLKYRHDQACTVTKHFRHLKRRNPHLYKLHGYGLCKGNWNPTNKISLVREQYLDFWYLKLSVIQDQSG